MTFIEITITVSLIAIVSLALYKSFSSGLRIWQKSRELVIEEDIAIFFDKFAQDLRNIYVNSTQYFTGDNSRVSFPAFVWMMEMNSRGDTNEYKEQMGQVEYFLDYSDNELIRRSANYAQAHMDTFGAQRVLVTGVERISFTYYYLTDDGEIFSEQVLETIPAGIEVDITFKDNKGERNIKRYFSIPIKI